MFVDDGDLPHFLSVTVLLHIKSLVHLSLCFSLLMSLCVCVCVNICSESTVCLSVLSLRYRPVVKVTFLLSLSGLD